MCVCVCVCGGGGGGGGGGSPGPSNLCPLYSTSNDSNLDLYLPRSFSHDFVIKLLKYNTSCVQSAAPTVLDGFFPYLTKIITGMRGCAVHNDFWPWPISSRSFSHNFVTITAKVWHILLGPICSTYSSEWILSIFDTNDHWHEGVCHAWLLTLTHIFKVIHP